ncbi:RNA polymerase sigma-54 factor [Neochlamydia sp. TUME1]|uniref:RNA polymerase factor sigma-54 n=1 Tax=Neochlamydia sp. TUME1 TaxID=1478174 RepID=UPI00057FA1DA|nr:RNA polymerase factor sigma-54 [Neochlamydia sp. TUME1]KIC72720.1 RNA polymerase sigma-54 factor [Neochlamydia sp. TUME1]
MSDPISLNLLARQATSLKQTQRLMMSPQMQQAIHLLQMPVLELSATVEQEVQQNPLLDFIEGEEENSNLKKLEEENAEIPEEGEQQPEKELSFNENDFEIMKKLDEEFRDYLYDLPPSSHRTQEEEKLKTFQESSIYAESSLFEYLMQQAKESFDHEEDRAIAEAIIGNFDENGFLQTPLQEIAGLYNFPIGKIKSLLKTIQAFEPYGVGAANMQESLLIQLRCRQKHHTLAYKILEEHYEDLIHNRIPSINKKLACSSEEISKALQKDISRLDLHPGTGHFKHFVQYITPDATIEISNDNLAVRINNDFLPSMRINRRYLQMLEDESLSSDTKEFIRIKLSSAKWLFKNVHQRNDTLLKILELLTNQQKEFFLDDCGKLMPLTMKSIAEQLNLHESTIARAVANKYIDTPRGILPLRSFFTNALQSQKGEDISSNTIKSLLKEIISQEDKKHPLSDATLSKLLTEKGMDCARRTIAKYRAELKLGNAQQRRQY